MENNLDYVKEKWNLLTAFSKKKELKNQLWEEVVYLYSGQHRYYHNLNHIAHLYSLCDKYLELITNQAVVGFAILYHDIRYDTYREDNEEQSALFAEDHLKRLNVNPSIIANVQAFIRATRDHVILPNAPLKEDLALFLDFDMAILGTDPDTYKAYSEKIRQEYAKYPDDIYKEGRKLALHRILSTDNIFATDLFRETMEATARENINREASLL